MVEVLAGDLCLFVITYGKPNLCLVSGFQIVWCTRSAHPCRHPSRLQGIGKNLGPAARNRESQKYIVKFAIGIGLLSAPWPFFPSQVVQRRIAVLMESGTQVNQS